MPLTTGQRRTALADQGVQATRQGGDEAVGLGQPQRRPHGVVVVDGGAEGDVAAHRVVEQERVLRHQRGLPGHGPHGQVADVDAVQPHRPVVRVHQPDQQGGDGGLARTGRADQRHRPARRHLEADVVQHLRLGVGEPHLGQFQRGGFGVRRAGMLAVRQRAASSQHPGHPLVTDDRARQLAEHPADHPDRERQQGEQVGDLDQLAGIECAVLDPAGADQQHQQRPELGQGLHQRVEQAVHPADPHHLVA